MPNRVIKRQFNKQAEKFANWWIGKNTEYLQRYFDFCDIRSYDKVLDVACGPGEFTIFIAKEVSKARGIDISDKEIEIAKELMRKFGLDNVGFDCSDVEKLPYAEGSYSVVLCKSAFHHFVNPGMIFNEMIRCCKTEGKISIQDIVAYEDNYVNDFFETFDKLVDISHNKTLYKREFNNLYIENSIDIIRDFSLSVDLNVKEYIQHAKQTRVNKLQLKEMLASGKNDKKLSGYLFLKNGELYFKRPVYLILGRK